VSTEPRERVIMLKALLIRDFVLVDRATIEFERGFSVLTGETGAGKSMLIDALELLVGGRTDAGTVRQGAERADVSAIFDVAAVLNPAITAWLSEHGFEGDEGQVMLRRTIDRSGRSRCFVNGHPSTQAQLREAGEFLLDIHGQHAHQSLLRAAAQRDLLDLHGSLTELSAAVASAYRDLQRLKGAAADAEERRQAIQEERADTEDRLADLDLLDPVEGEWDLLADRHSALSHGAQLLEVASTAVSVLSEEENACASRLAVQSGRLRGLAVHDSRLQQWIDLLESAEAQVAEAARGLRSYASNLNRDDSELRDIEARIELLHSTARRYRCNPRDLENLRQRLRERLADLELVADEAVLRKAVDEREAEYGRLANKLSEKRGKVSRALSRDVTAAMQDLAMKGGRFSVEIVQEDAPTSHGNESIEFLVAAHPSLPLKPIAKVASGGELARISLSIQLVASSSSPVGTLIFDEVDSGIGGAIAAMVGAALRKLGQSRQVLCVTHLPQVAAQGEHHWKVTKEDVRDSVGVRISLLTKSDRVEELARMLGGAQITAATRRHAAEMLAP